MPLENAAQRLSRIKMIIKAFDVKMKCWGKKTEKLKRFKCSLKLRNRKTQKTAANCGGADGKETIKSKVFNFYEKATMLVINRMKTND